MKIYTKTGDQGESSLWGGSRISKASMRIEAYGTVDELNSIIGMVSSYDLSSDFLEGLERVQRDLFIVGSDLATPHSVPDKLKVKRIHSDSVSRLENEIDKYTEILPELTHFILPSGSLPGATLHQARAVCRRAERACVRLAEEVVLNDSVISYLNRLSDWLFTAARMQNLEDDIAEKLWE